MVIYMLITPQRIQLSRRRGWRMPSNASKIDRTTRWGNPFKTGTFAVHPTTGKRTFVDTRELAIQLFALYLESPAGQQIAVGATQELKGRHLACWCGEGLSCHGDILLAVANRNNAAAQSQFKTTLTRRR